jgi:Fe-S-cluster-containing dehydrogenase component
MDTENYLIIVRCLECTSKGCAVVCDNTALAFMHGDLLVDIQKCPKCNGGGLKQGLPECIADCEYAIQKAIITELTVEEKRTQAVNALSLL